MDDQGRILVNEAFETNLPGVYAIGDVILRSDVGAQGRGRGCGCGGIYGGKGGPCELWRDSQCGVHASRIGIGGSD